MQTRLVKGRVLVLKTFDCRSVKMLSFPKYWSPAGPVALSGVTELLPGDVEMAKENSKTRERILGWREYLVGN